LVYELTARGLPNLKKPIVSDVDIQSCVTVCNPKSFVGDRIPADVFDDVNLHFTIAVNEWVMQSKQQASL
jgi:hypothetical protein